MTMISDLPKMTDKQIDHAIKVAKDFIIAANNELEKREDERIR